MTKKHFIAIAKTISNMDLPILEKEHVAARLAELFVEFNKNFDREKFMDAAVWG